MRTFLFALLAMLSSQFAWGVTAVNPFGVNVRSSGPTSVFLTFQNLDPGERAVEAFWCGELQPAVMATNPNLQLPFAVQTIDPCIPGTIFGRLPIRLDLSQTSTSGTFTNLTDVMSIPASVARRAYQDAEAGKNSAFFYVRRFSGGVGGDKFVIVTCRMAGGGARVPLALLDVRMSFETETGGYAPILVVPRKTVPPKFGARIFYNGTGTLRGRWEVVMPGDQEPTDEDLLTEASLPEEKRPLQRRYTLIDRFEVFLPPTGKVDLPGPDPKLLPVDGEGSYKILLRVEATAEKESLSNTGDGRLAAGGGVAGFPLPVLRYHVGTPETLAALEERAGAVEVKLFLPQADASVRSGDVVSFSWIDAPEATLYRLEIEGAEGEVLSALVKAGVSTYIAPPWFSQNLVGKPLRWRVVGLDGRGNRVALSSWRGLVVVAP